MIKIEKRNTSDVQKELAETHLFEGFKSTVDVILKDNTIVGFIDYSFYLVDSTIEINLIEILEEHQHNGYGKETISELFKKHPNIKYIKGLSHPEATGFWCSIGADFRDTCEDCDYDACTHHPNFNEDEWDGEYIGYGTCDDYSEDNFLLYRMDVLQQS